MAGSDSGGTKVTVTGHDHVADRQALAALCVAVERAVLTHRPAGLAIREIVVMLEQAGELEEAVAGTAGSVESAPVYVDVYDSGYGHGI